MPSLTSLYIVTLLQHTHSYAYSHSHSSVFCFWTLQLLRKMSNIWDGCYLFIIFIFNQFLHFIVDVFFVGMCLDFMIMFMFIMFISTMLHVTLHLSKLDRLLPFFFVFFQIFKLLLLQSSSSSSSENLGWLVVMSYNFVNLILFQLMKGKDMRWPACAIIMMDGACLAKKIMKSQKSHGSKKRGKLVMK